MTAEPENEIAARTIGSSLPRWLVPGGLVALLVLSGLVFTRNLIDFPVYYAAGQSLLSGRADLYSPDFARGPVMDYRYPPFFLIAFSPLWAMSYGAAALVWHLLGSLSICLSVAVLSRLLRGVGGRRQVWTLAFFVAAPYYVMALHYGNAHLLVAGLTFGALYYAIRKRDVSAAFLAAVALTIKLGGLPALVYFGLRRRLAFIGLAALLSVALNLVPAVHFGIERNLELLGTWYRHVVANQEFHEANGPINLSLKGQLRRYLTKIDYAQRVDGDTGYAAVNVASLTTGESDLLWLVGSGLAAAAVLAILVWPPAPGNKRGTADDYPGDDEPRRIVIEGARIGLVVCMILFVGPLTSKIYFIALLWPVCFLVAAGWRNRVIKWPVILIAVLSSGLPLLPGRDVQRLLLVAGIDFYLNFAVFGLLAYALILEQRNRLRFV
jgi:hypothetical protein